MMTKNKSAKRTKLISLLASKLSSKTPLSFSRRQTETKRASASTVDLSSTLQLKLGVCCCSNNNNPKNHFLEMTQVWFACYCFIILSIPLIFENVLYILLHLFYHTTQLFSNELNQGSQTWRIWAQPLDCWIVNSSN